MRPPAGGAAAAGATGHHSAGGGQFVIELHAGRRGCSSRYPTTSDRGIPSALAANWPITDSTGTVSPAGTTIWNQPATGASTS